METGPSRIWYFTGEVLFWLGNEGQGGVGKWEMGGICSGRGNSVDSDDEVATAGVFGEWPVARMEEYGAKKLAWGQIVRQKKEFGFYPVSHGSMTT